VSPEYFAALLINSRSSSLSTRLLTIILEDTSGDRPGHSSQMMLIYAPVDLPRGIDPHCRRASSMVRLVHYRL